MNDESQASLADILPLLVDQETGSGAFFTVIVVIALITISWFIWRHYHSPFTQLSHQLSGAKLSPREVAHQLAVLVERDTSSARQLDKLRFSRSPPDAGAVSGLLQKIRRDG